MATLIIDSGAERGKTVPLSGDGSILVGRRPENDLRLEDSMVSGRHFRLRFQAGRFFVEDLASTNGLWLNGDRVTSAEVFIGDAIRAGDTFLGLIADASDSKEKNKQIVIDGFEMQERVGVGGMGVVYKARQLSLDRTVAIKILNRKLTKDKTLVERFISEARAAGKLVHGNVVQVHDVGESNGNYFICMEYIDGGNLTETLRECGKLDENTVIDIAMDVAKGLEYAEIQGIVHCDIKPDNIMLTKAGVAKIADLGIARSLSEQQEEQKQEVMGSPQYMAPEQAQGRKVDCRSDLYALGCTLFRTLAGHPPFSGANSQEIMRKQVYETPPDIRELVPELGPGLADIIEKLMAKKPEERFPSATDLIAALDALESGPASSSERKKPARLPTPKPKVPVPSPGTAQASRQKRGSLRQSSGKPRRRLGSAQTSASSMATFMLLGLVGAMVAVVLVFALRGLARDTGADALREAQRLNEEGRLQEALAVLRARGKSRDRETTERINRLEADLRNRLGAQLDYQNYQANWDSYRALKARGAGRDELIKALERMLTLYKWNGEWAREIQREIASYN